MAKFIFLGPPGAGKGTQAQLLSKHYGIPHVSTGNIFRTHMQQGTELGIKAKEYTSKGLLVPDKITNNMVKQRLAQADCIDGFILDGYPRTIPQAQFLSEIVDIDMVIYFALEDDEILKRIAGRRTCPKCKKVYNIHYSPPMKKGICNSCGEHLAHREDESPRVVKKRIRVYKEQTQPLISFYETKGNIRELDASAPIEEIHQKVLEITKKIK